MELTPEEKALAARIGFDEDVLRLVKREAGNWVGLSAERYGIHLAYYRGYEKGRLTRPKAPPPEGFSLSLPTEVEPLVAALTGELRGGGYLPFVLERHWPHRQHPAPGRLAVLRTTDQFDIIRAGYPEGNDDYVDNITILTQLQDWDRHYGIEVIGANGDRLEIRFVTSPTDRSRVGAEAVALRPDLRNGYWELAEEHARKYYPFQDDEEGVENQMGYVVGRDIAHGGRLFLWWD